MVLQQLSLTLLALWSVVQIGDVSAEGIFCNLYKHSFRISILVLWLTSDYYLWRAAFPHIKPSSEFKVWKMSVCNQTFRYLEICLDHWPISPTDSYHSFKGFSRQSYLFPLRVMESSLINPSHVKLLPNLMTDAAEFQLLWSQCWVVEPLRLLCHCTIITR